MQQILGTVTFTISHHFTYSVSNSQTATFEIWSGVEYGDPLTIYDGSNDLSTEIEKLSGNLGSFSISSTGNSLFVKFESDHYYNYAGFQATIHYGNPNLNIK